MQARIMCRSRTSKPVPLSPPSRAHYASAPAGEPPRAGSYQRAAAAPREGRQSGEGRRVAEQEPGVLGTWRRPGVAPCVVRARTFRYGRRESSAMDKKGERAEQFAERFGWDGSSYRSMGLVLSARTLLDLALQDRRQNVYRLASTHYSPRAAAAVLTAVGAFDAFLNETYVFLAISMPWAREFASRASTLRRYVGLLRTAAPDAAVDATELEVLLDARNEIAHFLPRPIPTEGWVARLFEHLERRGVLMSTPTAPGWGIGEKLSSYGFAYWAHETIEAAIAKLVKVYPREREVAMYTATNFSLYRNHVCSPEQLGAYDRHFGLSLTERA